MTRIPSGIQSGGSPAGERAVPALFDRALLVRRRDRAAAPALLPDFLLMRSVDDMMDRLAIVRRQFARAAVVGAHHGMAGDRLARMPGVDIVVQTDASPAMLARCGGARVLADEEQLPFAAGALDLVMSALSLQHANDLPGVLAQIRAALKPDGLFLGSILGGRTLEQLRAAFLEAEAEVEGGASPRVAPFVDVRDVGRLLQRAGFALPVADSDVVSVSYATPLDLMRELRAMGAANVLVARRRSPLRRATLMRACAIYLDRFGDGQGRCVATFEIVTMTGWAPHASQPRPLAPGSATTRLADALRSTGAGLDAGADGDGHD